MSDTLRQLKRGLLGMAVVGSLGYGAVEAFASPADSLRARSRSCEVTGQAYIPMDCPECGGSGGYCDGYNTECVCFS